VVHFCFGIGARSAVITQTGNAISILVKLFEHFFFFAAVAAFFAGSDYSIAPLLSR
jgi:hypothetical protein